MLNQGLGMAHQWACGTDTASSGAIVAIVVIVYNKTVLDQMVHTLEWIQGQTLSSTIYNVGSCSVTADVVYVPAV